MIRLNQLKTPIFGFLATAALVTSAAAATPEDVDKRFHPYKNGVPSAPGVTPGMTINKSNVGSVGDALDPQLLEAVKAGEVEIKVGETTSFDLNKKYEEATLKGLNQVKLGATPGLIEGYVAGQPFPEELDISDPRAGEKAAWNFKYGYNWGDNAQIGPFWWTFRDMKTANVERVIKLEMHFLNFMHRVDGEPLPEVPDNPDKIFRAIYAQVQEPLDVKDTQLLIYRYEDDLKRDDAWLYLGFQRRVRRLATGQVTDSFLGADLMIEDFEGYNGRISDYKWEYKGVKNILLPFYYHNDMPLTEQYKDSDGYKYIDFGGQGNCYPVITWQLRKAYEVWGSPIDPNHPISKRQLYMDSQTFTIPRQVDYDRKGEIWKSFTIGQAHSDHHLPINKGAGVSLDDSFSVIDVQSRHCTTGQFRGIIDPKLNPRTIFTVQNMRSTGN